jgi:hypothetical protein
VFALSIKLSVNWIFTLSPFNSKSSSEKEGSLQEFKKRKAKSPPIKKEINFNFVIFIKLVG